MLKTEAVGLGFQHLPRDLANVNAWKTMFDPYNVNITLLVEFFTKDINWLVKGYSCSANGISAFTNYAIFER